MAESMPHPKQLLIMITLRVKRNLPFSYSMVSLPPGSSSVEDLWIIDISDLSYFY